MLLHSLRLAWRGESSRLRSVERVNRHRDHRSRYAITWPGLTEKITSLIQRMRSNLIFWLESVMGSIAWFLTPARYGIRRTSHSNFRLVRTQPVRSSPSLGTLLMNCICSVTLTPKSILFATPRASSSFRKSRNAPFVSSWDPDSTIETKTFWGPRDRIRSSSLRFQ